MQPTELFTERLRIAVYIAFDPGPIIGWCKFNNRGQELDMGQIPLDELALTLEEWPTVALRHLIIEQWIVIPGKQKAQLGRPAKAKIPTIEAIGVIKSWAQRNKVPFDMVSPLMLLAAQKWTQVLLPKDHSNSHQISAFLHGARWLIDHDLRPTALEMQHATKQEAGACVSNTTEVNAGTRGGDRQC